MLSGLYPAEILAECPPDAAALHSTIKFVADGDSVTLTDNRKVRIIGLNTPELHPDPQPFAAAARNRVRELLQQAGNQVTLVPGPERRDRHGRFLFHVILPDGTPLAETLIREGLGVQSAVAPNTTCAEHYRTAESGARSAKRGLWADDSFWRRSFRKLKRTETGFHLVQDRVAAVRISRDRGTITLKHGVEIQLQLPVDLQSVDGQTLRLNQLTNRMVEIRGWVYRVRGVPQIQLHAATNLTVY
ncbi:MAG: thermonuclease family protein [Gammaproteobacteria bacterium]|nr:thermonuclease family protein [Gammaproteobacteria bacterium]